MTLELQQLRDQVNLKRTSMNEHVSHLDMLRDEVPKVNFNYSLKHGSLTLLRIPDHHDDGAEAGPGEANRAAPGRARGALIHTGRVRRQNHHAGEAGQGARQPCNLHKAVGSVTLSKGIKQ